MGGVATLFGGVAGAGVGFLSGNQGKKSISDNTSGVNLNGPSERENIGYHQVDSSFARLQDGINHSGLVEDDVANGVKSSKDLANLLGDYQKSGGLPSSDDISSANDLTKGLFTARQTALNQSFQDQNVAANRSSALMGRSGDDPILQAKLRTGFMRQQDQLSAEQQSQSTQLALQLPQQRLGYATQRTNLLNQLGGQYLANQNFLLGLGNQMGSSERAWNYQTSDKYNNNYSKQGGGWIDGLSGAIGGLGAGMGAGSSAASAFGGGQGGGSMPGASGGGGGFSFAQPVPAYNLGNFSNAFSGAGGAGAASSAPSFFSSMAPLAAAGA